MKTDCTVLNSGLPQGCVLSPLLFSAYINELQCNRDDLTLIKYADDLVLTSCQLDMNSLTSIEYIRGLVQWFDDSHLQLNIEKTKELCCGNKNRTSTVGVSYEQITIKGVKLEQVSNFLYLGAIIDDKLSLQLNVDHIHKKARQRLGLLRKRIHFSIDMRVLIIVYRSTIESTLYNIISWYGHLTMRQKNTFAQVINENGKK